MKHGWSLCAAHTEEYVPDLFLDDLTILEVVMKTITILCYKVQTPSCLDFFKNFP